MISIGFLLGFALTFPIAFTLGYWAAGDRRTTHEPADITPALRRSSR